MLVLEDYHLISTEAVHEGVAFLLDHLPRTLELAIATRLDPPLPLARLRTRGEMLELRTAELRFDEEEAEELLAEVLGDALTDTDVERLVARTEGWPAGLYLAALSLGGREDAAGFIEAFAGDDRHIVDYLGGEVLEGIEPETREFLLRTSILERLCGPLCDHVLGGGDAVGRLLEIERANLFLVALDGRREWYRYHHLFGDLLRYELERSEPELIPDLHRRAAEWLGCERGDRRRDQASAGRGGRRTCGGARCRVVARAVQPRPARHRRSLARRPARAHRARRARAVPGARVGAARQRPAARGRALAARRRAAARRARRRCCARCSPSSSAASARPSAWRDEALAVASSDSPLGLTVANCILGIARYYDGALDAAAEALDEAVRLAIAGDNTLARIYALGYLGLVRVEQGDADAARASVAQALELAAEPAAAAHFVTAMALLAHGRLDGDDAALEEAVTLARRGAAPVEIAAALLGLGEHRRDPATLAEARGTLATCPDPGRLPKLIEAAELGLRGRRPGPRRQIAGDLSDRELAVLRLFPTEASLREIAGALYVSLNTVKTHSKSIYRKLGVSTRAEAVERARELDLL